MSCPGCCFSFRTFSGTSPLSSVAFHSSGSVKVVEATYFGRRFILTANSPSVSSMEGQAAAKPWYVTRPKRSASLAKSWSDWYFASSSLKYGFVHPPCSISPTPPGSCITPSTDTYSAATTFLISLSPFVHRLMEWGLTVAAGAGRCGQCGPVLILLHESGLASCVLFRRRLDTGQVLAAYADGGERDEQGK